MTHYSNDIKFSRKRYDLYDVPAKDIAKEWLLQLGFKDIDENLGESNGNFSKIWDVKGFMEKTGEWRIEAEIKQDWGSKWKEIPFRYDTVDIPYRKRDKAEEHATHHMVIGGDLKRLFIVNREAVLKSPVNYKKCRNRGWEEEPFFNVDIESPKSSFWFKESEKWKVYKK
jgi:hypothetical protein